jgi:hypothetical protein
MYLIKAETPVGIKPTFRTSKGSIQKLYLRLIQN